MSHGNFHEFYVQIIQNISAQEKKETKSLGGGGVV